MAKIQESARVKRKGKNFSAVVGTVRQAVDKAKWLIHFDDGTTGVFTMHQLTVADVPQVASAPNKKSAGDNNHIVALPHIASHHVASSRIVACAQRDIVTSPRITSHRVASSHHVA
jgi:hypothetical protein